MIIRKLKLLTGFAFLLCCVNAQANLIIDVSGINGTGITTWTFSTDTLDTVDNAGNTRTSTANTFSAFDTGQFAFGVDTILDTSIQDSIFSLSGNVNLNIGSQSEQITAIFLDDDGASADDLGIRTANELFYSVGETSGWSGAGTVNVDISTFVLDTFQITSSLGQAFFFADPITVTFSEVSAPTTLSIMFLSILGLVVIRQKQA